MLSTARNKYLLQRIERTLGQVIASLREMLARGRFRPAHAGVSFGDESGKLPAYPLRTPGGAEVRVSGKIDRIDVAAEDGARGLRLQARRQPALGRQPLPRPVAAALDLPARAGGERRATDRQAPHPRGGASTSSSCAGCRTSITPTTRSTPRTPCSTSATSRRGVFDGRFLRALDSQVRAGESSEGRQRLHQAGRQFGHRDRSDAANAQEFSTLLGFVRTRLGQIADEVIAGRIDVAPYRIGRTTPCPRCEYPPRLPLRARGGRLPAPARP